MLFLMQEVLRIVMWTVHDDVSEVAYEANLEVMGHAAESGYVTECVNGWLQTLSEGFWIDVEIHWDANPEFWPEGKYAFGRKIIPFDSDASVGDIEPFDYLN